VEQLIVLAAEAGLSMPHLAMAFTIAHPGVTCAFTWCPNYGATRRSPRRYGHGPHG
jgi:hypothetical protein